MRETIHRNLALFALVAALLGAAVSTLFREKVKHDDEPLAEQELLRVLELGSNVPAIAVSHDLTRRFRAGRIAPSANIKLDQRDEARLFIPDKYAVAAVNCDTRDPKFSQFNSDFLGVWFRGTMSGPPRTVHLPAHAVAGTVSFEGNVYRCEKGRIQVASTGVIVVLPLEQVGPGGISVLESRAWVTYPAAIGDMFTTFLLMIYIPTLTLSIVKAIVDSAQSERGSSGLFHYSFRFFACSTLVAGLIGSIAGYVCYKVQPDYTNLREIAAVSIGEKSSLAEFDAHPILSQFMNIIPINPLGALSNPDANKGLQVAFIAVVVGILLSVIGPTQRQRISQILKGCLALIIKDTDLKWSAISDWADLFTQVGIFFISLAFCATVSYDFIRQMGNLVLCILGAVLIHAILITFWIVISRDARGWFSDGLRPGIPGLVTALATSSSYAALPGIVGVDLLAKDSARRGIFDFCTTINKNGTTIYIATVATYVLFNQLGGLVTPMIGVVLLLSGLASVATAGLPLAAVFGLRMVLTASGAPGALAWVIVPLDPLIDRFVTVLNVFANLAACCKPKPAPAVLGINVFIAEAANAATQAD